MHMAELIHACHAELSTGCMHALMQQSGAGMATPELPPVMITVLPFSAGISHAGWRGSIAAAAAFTVSVMLCMTPPLMQVS